MKYNLKNLNKLLNELEGNYMNIEKGEVNTTENTYIDEELYKNSEGYCEWMLVNGDTYVPTLKIRKRKKIKPGVYKLKYSHKYEEYVYQEKKLSLDELLWLPDPIFDTIINDIEYFWNNEKKFNNYNFTYKRGILLYGQPGCGKSSICLLLAEKIIEKNGIVIYVNNNDDLTAFNESIPQFRMIESNTPVLCVLEDLDGLLKFHENETKLLNLLDGVNQLNNIVYIGNTNYPENLKDRITNRPSRFDRRYEIKIPNKKVRKFYLEKKITKEDQKKYDIDLIAEKTEGLSLAHLGEIIKSVFIFNKSLEESIGEIKNMNDKFISSSQYKRKNNVGFSK